MERWAPPAFHSSRSFLSPDPNSRSKPRREGYHRGNHVWGPNRLYTHPSPGTVSSLSDSLAGMTVLPWTPKSLGLFLQLRDLFPCFPGFLGRAKVGMALVKRVVGHFRANLVVTLCVLQTGGSLEPQANGETPQVAVVVRPGM